MNMKGFLTETKHLLQDHQILLCEDCLDQGRLYLKYLQMAGAEVTLECNGQAAVDAVRKSPGQFAVIVMDFQMPELDGLSATRQIRELGFTGMILAITAHGSEELKKAWREAGCDAYILKPLTREVLLKVIQARLPNTTHVLG